MDDLLDHDQRFKALVREFFPDFLRLFFADYARRFDLSHVEWLDKELFPEPPDGGKHVLDLVARLTAIEPVGPAGEPSPWLAVVHIEVESPDRTTLLKPRLPGYYVHLRERYGLPVLPVVLYLKVGLDGVGTDTVVERFWELEALTFRTCTSACRGWTPRRTCGATTGSGWPCRRSCGCRRSGWSSWGRRRWRGSAGRR